MYYWPTGDPLDVYVLMRSQSIAAAIDLGLFVDGLSNERTVVTRVRCRPSETPGIITYQAIGLAYL